MPTLDRCVLRVTATPLRSHAETHFSFQFRYQLCYCANFNLLFLLHSRNVYPAQSSGVFPWPLPAVVLRNSSSDCPSRPPVRFHLYGCSGSHPVLVMRLPGCKSRPHGQLPSPREANKNLYHVGNRSFQLGLSAPWRRCKCRCIGSQWPGIRKVS